MELRTGITLLFLGSPLQGYSLLLGSITVGRYVILPEINDSTH